MTWNLRSSRNLFFDVTKEPRESIWVHHIPESADADRIASPFAQSLLQWDPTGAGARSNCPELHKTMTHLLRNIDPRWRTRVGAIYAGRTASLDDSAFARHGLRGGMVAISLWYSNLLFVFVATYVQWGAFLEHGMNLEAAERVGVDEAFESAVEEILTLLDRFGTREGTDQYANAMMSSRQLFVFPTEDGVQAAHNIASAAEEYVVAHELSHHALRDSTSRPDRAEAARVLRLLDNPILQAEVSELNNDQLGEICGDVLAFEFCVGSLTQKGSVAPAEIALTLAGAVMALLAIGYAHDEWMDEVESHPGVLTRVAVVLKHAALNYGELRFGRDDETVTIGRLAGTLCSFVDMLERSRNLGDHSAQGLREAKLSIAARRVEFVDAELAQTWRVFPRRTGTRD